MATNANGQVRNSDPAIDANVTATRIIEELKQHALLKPNKCEVCLSKRGRRLYMLDIEMLTDQPVQFYIDFVAETLNESLPIHLEAVDSFFDLKSNLVIHLRITKSKKKKKKDTIRKQQKADINFVPAVASSTATFAGARERNAGDLSPATFDGKAVQEVTLRTSTATMTTDSDEGEEPTERAEERITERTGCAIPYSYEGTKRMMLESYLTKPEIFEKVRLMVAYLRYHKDTMEHYNGQTYVSIGVRLRCLGFPTDDDEVRDVYFGFCKSQGFTETEIEKDLQTYRRHLESQKISYYNNASRAHQTYSHPETTRRARTLGSHGPCDPECNIL